MQRIPHSQIDSTQEQAGPLQGHVETKIAVGISSCLLGAEVRYNGGHSRSRLCTDRLSRYFEFRSFCPEVAAGLGTPRPTLRLTGDPAQPKLAPSKGGADHASQLLDACEPVLERSGQLDGYILMKNSPSCGLERVKVYQANGHPHQQRRAGLFAEALKARWPSLPIEEEGRLHDPRLFENFITRVYVHHRFRHQVAAAPSLAALMAFHRDHKYLLMAHNPQQYRELGRLLGESRADGDMVDLSARYLTGCMALLARPASRRGHANALLHLMGYLKRQVAGPARQHMAAVVDSYRRGEVNLATPLVLLNHYALQVGSPYLRGQHYLAPYPQDLGLQNGV